MPRDSNGAYSLPAGNPVVSGTPIDSSGWGNPTMQDLGAEIQNSLDRAGRGPMTDQLKIVAGTISAPGLTWATDLNSGWYRAGDADFRFSVDGADILKIEDDLFTVLGAVTFSAGVMSLSAAAVAIYLNESGVTADEGRWRILADAEIFSIDARNDANTTGNAALRILRTGTTPVEIELNATLIDVNGVLDVSSTIELGHATDTTLARIAAGRASIEGKEIATSNSGAPSGSYTPTYSDDTGFDSTPTTDGSAYWIRIGDVVTVWGACDYDTSAAGTTVSWQITLPVASNFTTDNQLHGTFVSFNGNVRGRIRSEATANTAEFAGSKTGSEVGSISWSFSYVVV